MLALIRKELFLIIAAAVAVVALPVEHAVTHAGKYRR
jgi:hypothetical protein